jgi:hypothetical protein
LILLAQKFYSYNPAFVLLVFLIVTLIAWYGFKLWADSIVASPVVASPPVIPQAEPKPALKWQPPELPAGCTTVHILAGSTISTILVDSLTNEPRNVISLVVTPTPTGTNAVNISAFVKENRLYVRVPLPRGATTNPVPILMNNDLDEKLPPNWDRNYNQTAFEIVDEDESPLLQVVYKRPDDILVCGVFQSPAGILAVFPKSMNFISPQLPAQYRKPIFKYPSNLFPGVLAQ